MASSTLYFSVGVIIFSLLYIQARWARYRKYNIKFPYPNELALGHLKLLHGLLNGKFKGQHFDYVAEYLWKDCGNPPILFLDMRPVERVVGIVFSHSIAEQISRPSKGFKYGWHKVPGWSESNNIFGFTSIIRTNDEPWRRLRKQFSPGFAHSHLITLLDLITSKVELCLDRVAKYAERGEEVCLDDIFVAVTFDIIGVVVLGLDFNAQKPTSQQHPILPAFRALIKSYDNAMPYHDYNPFYRLHWSRLTRTLNNAVISAVNIQTAKILDANPSSSTASPDKKSVLALALAADKPKDGSTELPPARMQEIVDQVKSFLIAGHDTTSILLQWALYELSRHPQALARLRAELDEVLGPETSPRQTAAKIAATGDSLLKKLAYLGAVLKETLRLYPPAATMRWASSEPGTRLRVDDEAATDLVVEDVVFYVSHYAIHRDESAYGPDAAAWRPERWLRAEAAQIPESAYRPFERGSRSCIGMELADLEARVIMACLARGFEFTKVGLGRLEGGKVVGRELRNKRQVTAKPEDGMRMRISFTDRRVG